MKEKKEKIEKMFKMTEAEKKVLEQEFSKTKAEVSRETTSEEVGYNAY